ncbi:MAG: hypothetical protein ABI882_14890 [Acidobacteriota bacterium]
MISLSDAPGWLLTKAVRRMTAERSEWGTAMLAELAQLQHPSTRWLFALSCTRVALFPPRKDGLGKTLRNQIMKSIITNPRAAALIGSLLALPIPSADVGRPLQELETDQQWFE